MSWVRIGSGIEGESDVDQSGFSLGISSEGSVVAIGSITNSDNGFESGHVRIFENRNGSWEQIGADIDGEFPNDESGISVSLSSDGTIVAIGAHGNDGNGDVSGHVRIFENINGSWEQIGIDIEGESSGDLSGWAVSLSSDGSIVAIGAPSNDGNGDVSGHVRIFENINGSWEQIGADIDGESSGDLSGWAVSLSSDGSIVAIGAPSNDGNGDVSGHVRIFENINGSWEQIGTDIDGESSGDLSGWAVSLSSDGSIVAIGASVNDSNGIDSGHVRIFENINGSWEQIGADIDGESSGDSFGNAISLSSDGSIVAIGAPGNDSNGINSGHTRIYKYKNDEWTQIGADITGTFEGDVFGTAVSLSSNGLILASSATQFDGEGTELGHVQIFQFGKTLTGTSSNDVLKGDFGNDDINGELGVDIITGGEGNDTIDGGSGSDTSVYSGKFSDYSFTREPNSLKVADQRTGINDGTDTLSNIEYIQFSDQTVEESKVDVVKTYSGNFRDYKFYNKGNGVYEIKNSSTGTTDDITGIPLLTFTEEVTTSSFKDVSAIADIKGVFDQVTGLKTDSGEMFRLYNAAFARFPDADGLEYWIEEFSSGRNTRRVVAESFLLSEEFGERYGTNVSNAQFVETLYINILGREYDQEGYNYWLGNLNSGLETRYELLLGFAENDENLNLFTEMTGLG